MPVKQENEPVVTKGEDPDDGFITIDLPSPKRFRIQRIVFDLELIERAIKIADETLEKVNIQEIIRRVSK